MKYDWCFDEGQNPQAAYKTMRDALETAGRPIVFSICEWGNSEPWKWGKGIGHLWRTTPDIMNMFDGVNFWGGLGVVQVLDKNVELSKYAGPGHWNDPDMLQVGNGVLTTEENRSHFSLWCMLAAPLLAGNDLKTMDKETLEILTNPEVIAVNQDKLGKQGIRFLKQGDHETWVKTLENGKGAVCFFNRSDSPWTFDVNWPKDVTWNDVPTWCKEYNVRDLWRHKDLGTTAQKMKFTVAPHGVVMLQLTPKD